MYEDIEIIISFTYLPKPTSITAQVFVNNVQKCRTRKVQKIYKFLVLLQIRTDWHPFFDIIKNSLFSFCRAQQIILFFEKADL
jgi:hypothetical protein